MGLLDTQRECNMSTGFEKTVTVMAYELGDIAKSVVYGHLDYNRDAAYRAEAMMATADLITQCRVMAELLGADFNHLIRMGENRFMERAGECKEGVV